MQEEMILVEFLKDYEYKTVDDKGIPILKTIKKGTKKKILNYAVTRLVSNPNNVIVKIL